MAGKVLVVDDDAQLASYVAKGLMEQAYTVDRATNGRDALFLACEPGYSAIVLDRMLPGMDGLAVLKAVRAAGIATPVIVLSALGTTDDRVEGLAAGADDYLPKPFAFAELLARIQAVGRRARGGGEEAGTVLRCSDLMLDRMSRRARRGERSIALHHREYQLLEYLMMHCGEVVTRTMLLEAVWDYHFDPGTNVIDVHISRLRRKLEEDGKPGLLHTVRGAGYRLGSD